jgi:hypothetical protein
MFGLLRRNGCGATGAAFRVPPPYGLPVADDAADAGFVRCRADLRPCESCLGGEAFEVGTGALFGQVGFEPRAQVGRASFAARAPDGCARERVEARAA